MMANEPLYQYILRNIPRTRPAPPSMPLEFTQDPLNRHYDDRRTWLAWREPETPRTPARLRLGRMLVRLGRVIAGDRPGSTPAADATPA